MRSLRQGVNVRREFVSPAVSHIAQVYQDDPRIHWKLERVAEVNKGLDDYVRSVKTMPKGGLTR